VDLVLTKETLMIAGHGPNIGHGHVKYVVIDKHGVELPPVVFPAMISRAAGRVVGALANAQTVDLGGAQWWTGDDALLGPSQITMLAQERLSDPTFVPALVAGALQRLGHLNGAASGVCVAGLPATWAADVEKARALGERLRAAHPGYTKIRVIPEPLGLVYSALLDTYGEVVGDPALTTGRVAVVDLGHYTVDTSVLRRLTPEPAGLETFQLGTVVPLRQIRARLSEHFERELSLYETDLAVRAGALRVANRLEPLPPAWDRPLRENGAAIAARLVEAWGRGTQFDAILLGGGGAELPHLVEAIVAKLRHAQAVVEPQLAIARGYARLARRLSREAA
jgi:hypothetical protein